MDIVERLQHPQFADVAEKYLMVEAAEEITRLRTALAEKDAMLWDAAKALGAACGYMTNAAIDLSTGAPKKTALATINGGIANARVTLTKIKEAGNVE